MNGFARASVYFTAGSVGGLACCLALAAVAAAGSTTVPGLSPAPGDFVPWLSRNVILSGLWGLAFAVPMPGLNIFLKALCISLGPTVVQCLVIFPVGGAGFLGLELDGSTPLLVLAFNMAWSLAAALWLRLASMAA